MVVAVGLVVVKVLLTTQGQLRKKIERWIERRIRSGSSSSSNSSSSSSISFGKGVHIKGKLDPYACHIFERWLYLKGNVTNNNNINNYIDNDRSVLHSAIL